MWELTVTNQGDGEGEGNTLVPNDFSPPVVLIDGAHGDCRLYTAPAAVVCANTAAEVQDLFSRIERELRAGRHAAGYLTYELGYVLEPRLATLLPQHRTLPLAWFGIFDGFQTLRSGEVGGVVSNGGRAWAGALRYQCDEIEYGHLFVRIRELIAAGDIYQANLTFRAVFPFIGDPRALYVALRDNARADHCAYVDDGSRQILSLSPELFFEMSKENRIRVRPMKGTAARGGSEAEDSRQRAHLKASEKERAENLMIVDLLRNDLSRISETGSVTVEKLFEVETYPTLHQMTSSIVARRRADVGVTEIVRALFPCGSVTGAPKIRAMEIIRTLEDTPRGVYCGGIGAFAPDGSAMFNVAIRTITIEGNRGQLGVGGGIVYDSQHRSEYEECLLKARYFEVSRKPVELIETLRWSPHEGFVRLGRHLGRLRESARVFGITFDEGAAVTALNIAIGQATLPSRVRLTLGEDGIPAAAAVRLDELSAPWAYTISVHRVRASDVFLRYKTNRREVFDAESKRAAVEDNAQEVLFLNENGELTEGSRTNIFVKIGGELLTPSIACGLLNGCLRRELIESGICREAVLTRQHLECADQLYVGNSLRGLIPAIAAK